MRTPVFFLMLAFLPLSGWSQEAFTAPAAAEIRAVLRPDRPRLMLTSERLEALRAQSQTDEDLRWYVEAALAEADRRVAAPFDGQTVGGQSLFTAFVQLGLAWHWTGKESYADAAVDLMKGVARRATLAGANELQLGMMTNATALGYDWFHEVLPPELRARARELLEESLERCIRQYGGRNGEFTRNWWVSNEFNWNSVINGSYVLGTLAVADEVGEPVDWLLPRLFPNLRRAIETYNPDGVFPEGVGYWMYGTMHLVYALASLESALGTDFGLTDNAPGLEATGDWVIAANSPTDRDATFADPGVNWWNGNRHPLYWLAKRYDQPHLAARMLWYTQERKQDYPEFSVLWYPENPPAPAPYTLPPDNLFRSANANAPMAVTRGSADGSDALWAYLKGGNLEKMRNHHGHVDLGSFELAALGEHWAYDLAADDYGIQTGDDRFQRVYRMATRSHNTLMLDRENQPLNARADFIRYASGKDGMRAVLDLGKAYPKAARAWRGMASIGGRRALLIQDELDLPQARHLTWGLMTNKPIELDGRVATLRRGAKILRARILEPEGAVFAVESAYQAPPQNANNGYNRLMIEIPEASGNVRLAVLLSPVWPEGEVMTAERVPLAEWPSNIDPPPVDGTAVLFDQPSSPSIGTATGGTLPLQTIDAVATGPGSIGPEVLENLPGLHVNSHWIDHEDRIFAQSHSLPQTRNYLAFSEPGPFGIASAVRFVFDAGGNADVWAGGYNYTGPRIVATAGNSIYLGQALSRPTGGYSITFGAFTRRSHNETVLGFREHDEQAAPYRVRAAGFLLSAVNEGRTMTARFFGEDNRLLTTLTGTGVPESSPGEASGSEIFFAYDTASHVIEDWIHRIEIRGDNGGNVGFDEFCFTPVAAGGLHPWGGLPGSPDGAWRFTNLGPAYVAHYPWVFHPAFNGWIHFHPRSTPASQFAFATQDAHWIFTANSIGPFYFSYSAGRWIQLTPSLSLASPKNTP